MKEECKVWTKEELQLHIINNLEPYSAMVVIAALYKKLYGVMPKIGMSGTQAEFVEVLCKHLPEEL